MLFINGLDVTHLDSLYILQSVGSLRIYSNPNLTNLHGLEGLTNVTNLEITTNGSLVDLAGLNNLEVIGGNLEISFNASLPDLDGLNKLRHVNNITRISSNASLTTLDGMDQLVHPGSINIDGNQVLTDLSALSTVTNTSNLIISNNNALTSLHGLHNITRLWALSISLSNNITNLDELAALDSVTMDIVLDRNRALTSVAGLDGIRRVNNLWIQSCSVLTNVDGLNTIVSVKDLGFTNNPVLTNLNGLSGLKTIGSVRLYNNPALVNVDGLSSVETVSEMVFVNVNESLQNLNGLSGISGHLNNITVASNPHIENIDVFHAITSVGNPDLPNESGINITTNNALQNIDGLSAVTKVDGPLIVQYNPGLKDLAGLSSLKEVTGAYITMNLGLLSLNGLQSLEKVGGNFELTYNSVLSSLDGLSSLRSIGGSFKVNSNTALENIKGLGKLKSIGLGFQVIRNDSLISLEGLDSLSSIGFDPDPSFNSFWIAENNSLVTIGSLGSLKTLPGVLFIGYNPVLHDLNGFDSLKSISGLTAALTITDNALLENIDGLSSLKEVSSGGVQVRNNQKLLNLDGFKSLTTIYSTKIAYLRILNNALLNNIDGLSSLVTLSGASVQLQLADNPNLLRCCGLYPLLHYGGISGPGGITYNISGNGAGCTKADIEAGGPCEGVVTVEQPTALTFTAVTDTSMHISFTPPAHAPDGYITLMRENTPPTPDDGPWDGGTYYVGQKLGMSTVVTYGTQTGADLTGLAPNRTYYFKVFSYTEGFDGGNGNDYLKTNPLAGNQTTGATPNEGVTFSNVAASSMTVSFSADPSNPEGYILLMRAFGSPYPDDVPIDGTSYNVGQTIGSSTIVAGVGSQTSYNAVYLNPGTRYYFDIFKYTAGHDYDTDNYFSGNQQTLTEDPRTPGDSLAQPSNISFANVTGNGMTVSFTAPSEVPDGYITLMRAFGSPSPGDVPVDGTTYHVGNVIGSSTIVVGLGSSTSLDIVYLDPNTEYYFDIYSFNNTSEGVDYLTPGPLQGHQRTSDAFTSLTASKAAPFPNPFVDNISIPFTTTEDNTFVKVIVHDQSGKKIAEIVSDSFSAGYHEVQWDRRDLQGNRMGNGMYVYSIASTGKKESESGVIVAR
jgi:flagellar hook assembly protein FlgD